MPQVLAALRHRVAAVFHRLATEGRLRGEVAWVLASRTSEFALQFVLLKIVTNTLGRDGFGEFNLSETALPLLACVLLVPVHESYFRDFHGARERGEFRTAGMLLLRWYLLATLGATAIAALLTNQLAGWFGVGPWTALACGVLFAFDRWRFLGQEYLNIRRQRRTWALQNIGYWTSHVILVGSVMAFGPRTPAAAILAGAAAAAVFALIGARPMVRDIRDAPPGDRARLPGLLLTFGLPAAILLILQWVQGFGDRYIVSGMIDTKTAGQYVACYQVCGIPYQFMIRVAHALLTPIAYQRGRDAGDPSQLWSADRLLLGGIGVQAVIGVALLGFYALFGQRAVVALTNPEYSYPVSMILLLAAGRLAQALSQSVQPIFAVHHRMGSMLWFRLWGALLTLGICGLGIHYFGVIGAAAGSLLATVLYALGLLFAPNGCWWLVTGARQRARLQSASAPGAAPLGLAGEPRDRTPL